jgi:hypothetical protein
MLTYADTHTHTHTHAAVALDSEQQTIGSNDVVRVVDGQYKGQTATVFLVFPRYRYRL